MRKTSGIIKLVSLTWFSVVVLAACGGGAETEGQQNAGGSVSSSLITTSSSPDAIAYEKTVWRNLSSQSRCGRCHSTGGQQPLFVDGNSIETARAAALSFGSTGAQIANLASPNTSLMVSIIRNGHKQVNGKSQACWLASDTACADAIRDFIIDWDAETNGTAAVAKGVSLKAPSPLRNVGTSKAFPSAAAGFSSTVYPVLTANCADCHVPTPSNPNVAPQSPYFASSDVDASYLEAQQKMDLLNPANSRLVIRLRDQFHNCWTTDCSADAAVMQAAITAFSDSITPTQVDPSLVVSKAMQLKPPEAIIATGGERHVTSQIALWEFKSGVGSTQAFDTSGVEPVINLSLSGDYSWVGGYGIQFNNSSATTFNGRAQASYQASQKLLNNIRTRGEYSIEAWVIPSNVVQQIKNIISYSGSTTERNFTIAQNEYNYQFYNRATTGGSNANDGGPVLETDAGDQDLQASQQHIVMNYDPVNGRRLYINGIDTGDLVANDVGGLLTDWDNTFAFILANELGTTNGWQGTLRMVAVHNRILTDAQIQQNFKAGVGEKFFLLFSISHIAGVPADSYIKVQVEQYDTYSYLFNNPIYVNLGSPVPAINFPIKGMRIGINGKEAIVGQSFVNLKIDGSDLMITANNQEISRLGSVIQLQQGTTVDDFFLSFETLGTQSNPFVVAAPSTSPTPADLPVSSDIGIRTFSEINGMMSELTGVPTNNSAVLATYVKLKQQLPSSEDLSAFGPANIIGISQLAFEYCDRLVEDTTLRDNFFGVAPYSFNGFGQDVATAFGPGLSTEKRAVVNALYDRMIGIPSSALGPGLINAPLRTDIMTELVHPANSPGINQTSPPSPENLFDRLVLRSCVAGDLDCSVPQGTKEIVKAMCTSVLASAATLVQ